MICKICNSEFNTLQGLSNHLFYKHKIEKSDYYLKYINNNCYCMWVIVFRDWFYSKTSI